MVRLESIPVEIEGLTPETVLMKSPPSTVAALFQTTTSLRPTIGSRSFQGVVSLEGLGPGTHRVPVEVFTDAPQARVLSVEPPSVEIDIALIVTKTAGVTVEMMDQDSLSRAYQVVGTPEVVPGEVEIIGAEPLIDRVTQVVANISLANASTSLREVRPLHAVDETGREVTGLTMRPPNAQVNVTIRRRINARDVGVRVVTEGSPAPGYWVSDIDVTPASVTLQGNPEQLDQIAGFVETLPTDLTNTTGSITLQVPLDLPPGVSAVDSEGNTANTVTVKMQVDARLGNMSVKRPVKLIGASPDPQITVTPVLVDLILAGSLPTLNQIETDPDLVQVLVDVVGLEAGTNIITPTVIAPDNITAQVVPPTVSVNVPANGGQEESSTEALTN
jgi:YbbR domain-containing protein